MSALPNSAIELYKEAYDLHFKRGKPEMAQELYKKIIARYPDSEERKYAQFLLERSSVSQEPREAIRTSSASIVPVLAFVIAFVAIAGTVGLFFMMKSEQKSFLYFEKVMLAMNAIQNSNYSMATMFLREAKTVQPKGVAAYSIMSQIYLKDKQFKLASAEYKQFLSLVPKNIFAQEQLSLIAQKKQEEEFRKKEEMKRLAKPVQRRKNSTIPSEKKTTVKKEEKIQFDNKNINFF